MAALELLTPEWTVPDNVIAGVTTRRGGVSEPPYDTLNLAQHVGDAMLAVEQNRARVAAALDADLRWQWLEQVHGTEVRRVAAPTAPLVGDALVTSVPGLVCCVMTADCLSVFFTDRKGTEVAVAHAGWRGLVAGVLEDTVQTMAAAPSQVSAWLGPAIGPCHFEVGAEVRDAFVATAGDGDARQAVAACFLTAPGGKYLGDLFALARLRLAAIGLESVTGGGHCTFCDSDRCYSHRRQNPTGRLLSLIYLEPVRRD